MDGNFEEIDPKREAVMLTKLILRFHSAHDLPRSIRVLHVLNIFFFQMVRRGGNLPNLSCVIVLLLAL